MPCLPYSQDRAVFNVDKNTGIIHSEMNTPALQMAYANRRFLKMVHESGKLGRVAFKPTQAMEDGINSGILSWLLDGTKFKIGRKYAVDGYTEHKELIDRVITLLPDNFKEGMDSWEGQIEQHISDTNYGLLLWDLIEQKDQIVHALPRVFPGDVHQPAERKLKLIKSGSVINLINVTNLIELR